MDYLRLDHQTGKRGWLCYNPNGKHGLTLQYQVRLLECLCKQHYITISQQKTGGGGIKSM